MFHAAEWTRGVLRDGLSTSEVNASEVRAIEYVIANRSTINFSQSRAKDLEKLLVDYRLGARP